jgi:hypothetical protein
VESVLNSPMSAKQPEERRGVRLVGAQTRDRELTSSWISPVCTRTRCRRTWQTWRRWGQAVPCILADPARSFSAGSANAQSWRVSRRPWRTFGATRVTAVIPPPRFANSALSHGGPCGALHWSSPVAVQGENAAITAAWSVGWLPSTGWNQMSSLDAR